MMPTFFIRILFIFLSASLFSCASIHKNDSSNTSAGDNIGSSAADLLNSYWHVSGKLAIRALSPNANSPSAQTLRFDWQQKAEDYNVTLTGPLGFGRVTVSQHNQRIHLRQGKRHIEANDIDQLFAQQTGLNLPISYLRYWALGIPSPEQPFTANNLDANKKSDHLLASFKQDGWQIHFPSVTLAAPYPLPSKMIASNKHFKLIIAFKHWQFPLMPLNKAQPSATGLQ